MKLKLVILLVVLFIVSNDFVSAQCAMCKAVVESNAQTNDNIVEGVNSAILYLMGVPYALVLAMGFLWYKKFGKGGSSS